MQKTTYANLCALPIIGRFSTLEREFEYIQYLFKHQKIALIDQLQIKRKYEKLFLLGKFSKASTCLDYVYQKYGASLWLIENKIYLNYSIGGLGAAKAYCEEIKESSTSSFVGFIIDSFFSKVEGETPELHVKAALSYINEFRTGGATEMAEAISSLILPIQEDAKRNTLKSLLYLSNSSIIDQYLHFKRAIIDLVLVGNLEDLTDHEHEIAKDILFLFPENSDLLSIFTKKINCEFQTSSEVNDCIKQYTLGNYGYLVDNANKLLCDDIRNISLLGIIAKSFVLSNSDGFKLFPGSPFQEIFNDLLNLYKLSSDWDFCYRRLEMSLIKYCNQSWVSSILISVSDTFPNTFNNYRSTSLVSALIASDYTTPKFKFLYQKTTNRRPEIFEYICDELDIKAEEIPRARRIKYNVESIGREELNTLVDDHLLPFERTQLTLKHFILNMQYSEAARYSVEECLKKPILIRCLPVADLISTISNEEQLQRDCGLVYPILQHIYESHAPTSLESQLGIAYETFMFSTGKDKPSEYFSRVDVKLSRDEVYFLRNICTENVMDISPNFQSSEEIHAERIKIIDLLSKQIFGQDREELDTEKDGIITSLIIKKHSAGVQKNKIDVDISNLLEARSAYYKQIFDHYLSTEDGKEIEGGGLFEYKSGDSDLVYISDKKESILARLVSEVISDFVASPEFGLNKSLSTNIRHGFLTNHLRARPESLSLITSMSEGKYEPNVFWAEKYSYIAKEILDSVDGCLRHFSEEYDRILKEGKAKIDVETVVDSGKKLFSYPISYEWFVSLKDRVNSGYETFIQDLIDDLWHHTDECLKDARAWVHDDFQGQLDNCYEVLTSELEAIKNGVGMADLDQAINIARGGLKEDILDVISWFYRADITSIESIDIPLAVRTAVNIFETIHHPKPIYVEINGHDLGHTLLANHESKNFIISIVTALNNAQQYGLCTSQCPIVIDLAPQSESNWHVSIKNSLKAGLPSDELSRLKNIISGSGDSSLAIKEGGTGLYKIVDLLKKINLDIDVNIKIEPDYFSLGIVGNYEHSCS